jgi:hypothetical protein
MTKVAAQNDEEARAIILEHIEKYGCHLILIEANNYLPAFVYSIGLYQRFGHPEIICFGLDTDVMAGLINYAADKIKEGEVFTAGQEYVDFLEGSAIRFVDVDRRYYPNYVGYAGWFYNMTFDFPVLQLVWPDKALNFPWEAAFNRNWKFKQPLLDRNIDFKFYEERNLGVYTTKQAFVGDPILYVYHNDNGDWQFHTSSEPKIEDAVLVELEDMTNLDPTINELYHLQLGWHAWRETAEGEWEFAEGPGEGGPVPGDPEKGGEAVP